MGRHKDRIRVEVKERSGEGYTKIDEAEGSGVNQAIYRLADKHYGGIGEMIATDFANEWNDTFSPEAFKKMLEPRE